MIKAQIYIVKMRTENELAASRKSHQIIFADLHLTEQHFVAQLRNAFESTKKKGKANIEK